jgi:ubiquinone/menaquinone biosynthesis C-methylase UbiE
MGLGDRFKAALYDAIGRRFEQKHGAAKRRKLLADATGRVLEIGAGTGLNLAHYPAELEELVVTEPNDAMRRRAQRRVRQGGRRITLLPASAEALPFPDESFDTVVGTLVLCTVPDQAAALREIQRVLRPGGRLLFIEHVRSDDPRRARWQDRLERPWMAIADGCHPNRDTRTALEAAGFRVEIDEQGEMPMLPKLVKPYIIGRATKPESQAIET